jgi:GNAT superfamily N-acetyltransferase
MRFRWDWLGPVVLAPYVPTLGPVGPDVLSVDLFNAVQDVARTGRFLSYDKDRRWFENKDERVIVEEVIHRPGLTLIPTHTRAARGLIKLYHYGRARPDLEEMAEYGEKLCALYGAERRRAIWLQAGPDGAKTRLMLKAFGTQDLQDHSPVLELGECACADTFAAFAQEIGPEGFSFLHQRMKGGHDDGPVLVTVEDRRIVGALGPLGLLTDANGTTQQPPQYFAVHPAYRGRGHGRSLWRAAMAWGHAQGAVYKVLQASSGSHAEQLYLSEGLRTLGFMCSA